jgi:chromate transport protein ChrA
MRIQHTGIIFLIFLSIFGVYDIFGVDVWTAVIVAYMFTYLPVAILLFILSLYSKQKDHGWQKKLDIVGIYISVISVVFTILYFVWDSIRLFT